MFFVNLDAAVKRQIKASMKRIASNLIKINIQNLNKVSHALAFQVWSTRFLRMEKGQRYYDFILVCDVLLAELEQTMKVTFNRALEFAVEEIKAQEEESPSSAPKAAAKPKPYAELNITPHATVKQLNYANYLMNMINNSSLPEKRYSKAEMSVIISGLKKKLSSAM